MDIENLSIREAFMLSSPLSYVNLTSCNDRSIRDISCMNLEKTCMSLCIFYSVCRANSSIGKRFIRPFAFSTLNYIYSHFDILISHFIVAYIEDMIK